MLSYKSHYQVVFVICRMHKEETVESFLASCRWKAKDQIRQFPCFSQLVCTKKKERTYIQNSRVYIHCEKIATVHKRNAIKSLIYKLLKIKIGIVLMQSHRKYKASSGSMWKSGTVKQHIFQAYCCHSCQKI